MAGRIGPAVWTGAMCIALLLPVRASWAWGPEGHRVIALIADQRLQQTDAAARAKILALLATDKTNRATKTDLVDEATWADVLIEKSPEARTATSAWHATRLKADNPDLAVACFDHKPLPEGYPASHGPQDNCSVDKIEQFREELGNTATSSYERLAAVKFLLNLVGDLNDPLLAIDHGDRGGQCTAVQVGGHPPVRLATYWQETLLREVAGSSLASGAARIVTGIPAADMQKWTEGNPESWLQDTYEIAKTYVYNFGDAKPEANANFPARKTETPACATVSVYKLGADYETKGLAAVRTQLAKAGLRLAQMLRGGAQ